MKHRILLCTIVLGLYSLLARGQHEIVSIPPSPPHQEIHALSPSEAMTDYMNSVLKTEQGLPQNSVWALCQTHDNYLWLGTQEGLVRYDGVRFTVFDRRTVPAMTSNLITVLLEDKNNALWIGTKGGGLLRFKGGKWQSYTTQNGLSNNDVTSLLQDHDGTVWIGTNAGLNSFRYDNGDTVVRKHETTIKTNVLDKTITALRQDHNGALWVGTTTGLHHWHRDSLGRETISQYTTANGLSDNFVTALLQDREGSLWIGTTFGVNRLERQHHAKNFFTPYTTTNGLSNNLIHTLLQDSDGTLWIGTAGGVNRLRGTSIDWYNTKNGLSNDDVRSMVQTQDGSLWIGTHAGGVNHIQNSIFASYTSKNGLSNDAVTAIMGEHHDARHSRTDTNSVWIGTHGGGLNYFHSNKFTSFTTQNGLSNNVVRSLLQDIDGSLWVGTYGNGINHLKNGRFSALTTKNGLSNDFVWSLLQSSDSALWIGTEGGGLNWYKNRAWRAYTTKNGLSNDFVRVLIADQKHTGALWIGTYGGGLNYFRDGIFTHYTTKNGLSNDYIRSLMQDHDGVLWIGTQGGGLHRFKDGKFTVFTTKNGLFDDGAWCILEDDFGYLWMSCNKGIYRVRKADLNAFADGTISHISCKSFGIADGMKSIECNSGNPSGWKSEDGRLWFPTMMGALAVSPNKSYTNPLAPPIIIESIKADSITLDLQTVTTLPSEIQKLEFRYTATNFLAPEKVQFKYMLEGYDKEWTDAGTRRIAFYTNLPRGRHYRFHVIACNNDGVWNRTGAAAMFSIAPYFWETWWFYVLSIIIFSAAIYLGIQWRVRRLQMRAALLERLVEERTEEVQTQAAEIQRTNTELQEKNIELHDANQFKTQMLSMASHDLKNPLSNVMLLSQFLMKEAPENNVVQEYAADILTVSRQMLNLVYDLLDTASQDMQKKQMDIHFERLDMSRLVADILVHYTSQAEQKRQQLIVNCQKDCWIAGDYKRLLQVVENLISNAIKYSPFEKRIWVQLETNTNDTTIIFSVRDEGPGITEEDKNKMFGFFQRLSATPTGGESSSGVGLAIVKQIIELHNGLIWVESEPGNGATFIVALPIAPTQDFSTHAQD